MKRTILVLTLTLFVLLTLICFIVVAQTSKAPVKESNPNAWKEFSSVEGKFTVSLPGTPNADIAAVGTTAGVLKTYLFVLETDTFLYYISFADLPKSPKTPEEHKAALKETRDRTAAKRPIMSETDIMFDGVVGKELLVEGNHVIQLGRFFYAKERLYHLIINASPDIAFRNGKASANAADRTELFATTSKRFFDSFKLTN